VDFAIWLLFQKSRGVRSTVQHLLCQGYRKYLTSRAFHRDENVFCNIPGLVSTQPNTHVKAMKEAPWPRVLTLLGKDGERTMVDLILDCGIFLAIESGHGSYYQLSGKQSFHCYGAPAKSSCRTSPGRSAVAIWGCRISQHFQSESSNSWVRNKSSSYSCQYSLCPQSYVLC